MVLHCLVTGADLCDNKVKEYYASDNDDAEPDEPEQAVLERTQLRRLIECEVADRDADDREDVRNKSVDMLVFYTWIRLGAEGRSHVFVGIQLELPEVYYGQHQRKLEHKDEVEEDEGTQIREHAAQHGHEEGELREDPQEEECFHHEQEGHDEHYSDGLGRQYVAARSLINQVGNAKPDEGLVQYIPEVFEVPPAALTLEL